MKTDRETKKSKLYTGHIVSVEGETFQALLKREGHPNWMLEGDVSAVSPQKRQHVKPGQEVSLDLSNPERRGLHFRMVDDTWH